MKVELLGNGAPECPLVRFYGGDPGEFRRLRDVALSLANAEERSQVLCAEDGFELLGFTRVILTNASDGGMVVEEATRSLKWSLASHGWEAVAELIDPLCSPEAAGGFQWLDEAGGFCTTGLAVLASVSDEGRW